VLGARILRVCDFAAIPQLVLRGLILLAQVEGGGPMVGNTQPITESHAFRL
jgi:hypothetical protein